MDAYKRDRQARIAEARAAHEYSQLLDCTFTPAITRKVPRSTGPVVVRGLERYMELQVCSCTVLYCTVLYRTVLYCTVLYCTVLYCTVLYCTVLHCTVLYGSMCCAVLCCAVLHTLHYTVNVPYHTLLAVHRAEVTHCSSHASAVKYKRLTDSVD